MTSIAKCFNFATNPNTMQYGETILLFYVIACSGWTICPDARNANRHYKRGDINIGNVSEAYLLIETTGGHQYEGWIY